MKEKDNYTNVSDRQTGNDEIYSLWGFPLYSAGEDFYSIYHEVIDLDPKNISETSGVKQK